jgi:hypothetical protein
VNSVVTPEQAELLLTLAGLILVAVLFHLAGRMAWSKWTQDGPDDGLTQEERDERRVTRRRPR